MCLAINKEYPKQPDGSIRYKVVREENGQFFSPYYHHEYLLNKEASGPSVFYRDWDVDSHGYHVFVNLSQAKFFAEGRGGNKILICKCKGFVAGGRWLGKSEIWKSITPLEVYDFWKGFKKLWKGLGNIWRS